MLTPIWGGRSSLTLGPPVSYAGRRKIFTSLVDIPTRGFANHAARMGTATIMSASKNDSVSAMQHRINAEIQDTLDEDLELELEDHELADLLAEGQELPDRHAFPRKLY